MCTYFCFSELKRRLENFKNLSLHLLKWPGSHQVVCVPCLKSLLPPSALSWPQSTGSPLSAFASTEPSFLFTLSGFLAIRVTSPRSLLLFEAAGYCILWFPGISHSRPRLMIRILVLVIGNLSIMHGRAKHFSIYHLFFSKEVQFIKYMWDTIPSRP